MGDKIGRIGGVLVDDEDDGAADTDGVELRLFEDRFAIRDVAGGGVAPGFEVKPDTDADTELVALDDGLVEVSKLSSTLAR